MKIQLKRLTRLNTKKERRLDLIEIITKLLSRLTYRSIKGTSRPATWTNPEKIILFISA
jgi:hypothetical protein